MKKKVCIVLTSRGNYAKTRSIMDQINKNDTLELQLILGGSFILDKYGSINENKTVRNYIPNSIIHFVVEGENLVTMAKSAGLAVIEFANVFNNLKPNIVLVLADRFESLSITMAATYMNIPVAHIEGGEISGSIDESIRHAITKMAHIHFPASEGAYKRIIKMGEQPETVFNVGCTSFDVLKKIKNDNLKKIEKFQNDHGVGNYIKLEKEKYLIVIQHPVTTEYKENLKNINETIYAIEKLKLPTIWIWPNMDAGSDGISKGIRMFRENKKPENVHFFKSLPIEMFGPLLNNSACIIGNSSTGIRESAFLGIPSVNIGSRQNGRECSKNVYHVENNSEQIYKGIKQQIKKGRYEGSFIYGNGKSGKKIVDILTKIEVKPQKRNTY